MRLLTALLLIAAALAGGAAAAAPARSSPPAPPVVGFGAGPCGSLLTAFVAAPAESLVAPYRTCVGAHGDAGEREWLDSDLALMRDLLALGAAPGASEAATLAQKRLTGDDLVASASRLSGSYGTGPGQYNCTTFLIAALGAAGYATGGLVTTYINIDFPRYEALFARRDPRVKGVVTALVASGQAVEVTDPTALRPGDVVQYWYRHGDKLLGHSGMIAAVRGGGHYDLLGAHKSVGHVGILKDLNLSPGSKAAVFAARPVSGGRA